MFFIESSIFESVFRMTSVNSETFPTWSNHTNYGNSYGTEGETNCSDRFERKSIPENETVFIIKTIDKEELISEIKGGTSSSWSGALTATIIGKSFPFYLRRMVSLIRINSPLSSHRLPINVTRHHRIRICEAPEETASKNEPVPNRYVNHFHGSGLLLLRTRLRQKCKPPSSGYP